MIIIRRIPVLASPDTVRFNFFPLDIKQGSKWYEYSISIDPEPKSMKGWTKRRILDLFLQSPQGRIHAGYVVHNGADKLYSAKKLQEPIKGTIKYFEDGDAPGGGQGEKMYTVSLRFLNELDTNVDAVVGVALNGVPLANIVAYQYGIEMAVVHPGKHGYEEGKEAKELKATLSENYSGVRGKRCVIIDDVITTGGTIEETIKLVQDEGGEAVAVAVIIDKKGVDSINSVPVCSLIKVGRVG